MGCEKQLQLLNYCFTLKSRVRTDDFNGYFRSDFVV